VPVDLPAAVDPLGRGRGVEERHVVSGLAVQGGEDLARDRLLEDPAAGLVTGAQQVGRHARPVHVHVDGKGGRRGDVGDPAHGLAHLVEAEAVAAELGRHGNVQKASGLQLLEVLGEEGVVVVIGRGALVHSGEQVGRYQLVERRRLGFVGGHDGAPVR